MREAVFENPVINAAFEEPRRHVRFTDGLIIAEITQLVSRRPETCRGPALESFDSGARAGLRE